MPAERELDAHSWLVVVTFMIVIAIVIRPVRIPLCISSSHTATPTTTTYSANHSSINDASDQPVVAGPEKKKTRFPQYLTLDIATAPVIGVLFLLATRSINGESVRDGILGSPSSGVEPYAVMILFFSLVKYLPSLSLCMHDFLDPQTPSFSHVFIMHPISRRVFNSEHLPALFTLCCNQTKNAVPYTFAYHY